MDVRRIVVRFPEDVIDLDLLHVFQTGFGPTQRPIQMGSAGECTGSRASWAWSWPLTSTSCRHEEWVELHIPSGCAEKTLRRYRKFYSYLLTYSMERSPSSEANRFSASQEIPLILMEPEDSLPHSQVPATCPYPEPARSSPYPHILLPEDPS